MDSDKLKALGITLKSSTALERAYEELKGIPLLPIEGNKLMVLDLNALPTKPLPFKEIFLRWALSVQEGRILFGDDPIFPYELVKRCPIWKLVSIPIRTLKLTQEGMFNKPSVTTVGKQPKVGSINKAR